MIIIGVDFHPEFQQIASVDTDTGEFLEKRLVHREEGRSSTVVWWRRARRYGLEWKPAATHAGSSDWLAALPFESFREPLPGSRP
jgi:hypothetical protein